MAKSIYEQYYPKDLKTQYEISGRNHVNEKTQLDAQMEAWASEFIERLRYLDPDIKKPEHITRQMADRYAKQNGLKKKEFWKAVERIKREEFKKKL